MLRTKSSYEKELRDAAAALINTKNLPPTQKEVEGRSAEAWGYHNLNPYPRFAFHSWKTEERGNYPTCLPLPRTIIRKGANWLFGKPIIIKLGENKQLTQKIAEAWQKNRMPTRMVAAAEMGGVEGGVALKYCYDEGKSSPLQFQILSIARQCQLFYDSHDKDLLLMARIQYPYFDYSDGMWYGFREEWTAGEYVTYEPLPLPAQADVSSGYLHVLGDKWVQKERSKNIFGTIPITQVKNIDTEQSCFGWGDLWNLYRVIDRINLTYHLMDRSNQKDSDPNLVYIDVDIDQDEAERAPPPGSGVSLKSDSGQDGSPREGKVSLLEPAGKLRDAMKQYADDLRQMLVESAGSVDINTENITNKGNLSHAVMAFLHTPIISMTEEKRKTYGEDGIAKFLENCLFGLTNAGIKDYSVNLKDEPSYNVSIIWPDYFELSEEERSSRLIRIKTEYELGFLSPERAARAIASLEGLEDVDQLITEVMNAERKTKSTTENSEDKRAGSSKLKRDTD